MAELVIDLNPSEMRVISSFLGDYDWDEGPAWDAASVEALHSARSKINSALVLHDEAFAQSTDALAQVETLRSGLDALAARLRPTASTI